MTSSAIAPAHPFELTQGTEDLLKSVKEFLSRIHMTTTFKVGEEIDKRLNWVPSLHFVVNGHLIIAAEISNERPYPEILRLRHVNIGALNLPIAVYAVCPEEVYLREQKEAKELESHGYGLITVAEDGTCHRRADCIPLVQQISTELFAQEIKNLPARHKQWIAEAFETYKRKPAAGVGSISEVLESLVYQAGLECVKKKLIAKSKVKPGSSSEILDELIFCPQTKGGHAVYGGVKHYIKKYRNTAHHPPANAKQAYTKYLDCRHAFIDGIKKIVDLRESLKQYGLSGRLSSV